MRKYKLILFGIAFFLFASFASAILTDDLVRAYTASGSDWTIDEVGGSGGDNSLKVWSSDPSLSSSCGLNGDCIDCDGDDAIKLNGSLPTGNVTFSIWIRPGATVDDNYVMRSDQGTDHDFSFLMEGVSGETFAFRIEGGNTLRTSTAINEWRNYVMIHNDSGMFLYFKGELYDSQGSTGTLPFTWSEPIAICSIIGGASNFYTGELDEWYIWDRSLSPSEIATLNDSDGSGDGFYPFAVTPPPSSSTLNLSAPLPINESSFNVPTVNVNLSANSSTDFNCSIYINDTLNTTTYNHALGENRFVDFNVTFDNDGEYNYIIGCTNLDNDTNTSSITFFMDFEVPTITTDFINYSVFFMNNITAQFNFTDNILLHSFNISIDDKLIFNITHIHETTYQYNLSWNVTNLSLGVHNITIFIADGHTSAWLNDEYEWSNGLWNNYMEYEFVEGGYIRTELKDKSIFDEWTTERLFDRYTQTLEPANPSETLTFVEESDLPIYIVNKPGHYKDSWIVVGNHWKDYVLKDEPDSKVSIKRINDYKVEVTITEIKNNQERLEFESIGDLNIVEVIYPFIVSGAEETFTQPILEFQTQTMTLRMNTTSDLDTSAILVYDGAEQTVTNTSFSTYDLYSSTFLTPSINETQDNITFYWQYEFTAPGTDEAGNLTFNQTVNGIGFDNCTTFTTVAINITVKNETTGSAITDNTTFINGYFKAWKSLESSFVEFNLTWGGDPNGNYGLCIDPADVNYTMDAQLEYGATGFSTKLYYFNDYFIDNLTDTLDLFLTEGTTQVTLTVKDFDDSVVEAAVIKVLSYDVGSDSSKTTEIVETDSSGEAFVQLVLNTEWYVFIVEVDGVIKLQTIPTRVTSSAKTLRIDLQDIKYFDRYDVTRGITHSLTWTNATTTFTFTWSDPTGDMADGCLKVSRRSINSESVLSDACTTSSGATRTYTVIDNITDQIYIAVSYIKFADGESYVLDTLTISFEQTFKKFGLTGIFASFLLILTLMCIGIWHPVIAVIGAIFGLIIVSVLGIFSVSWGVLIGVIIMGGILIYRLTKN